MTDTLTRRSLVKVGIWAVPVVSVAVATPLAAASEPYPPVQTKNRLVINTKDAWDENPNNQKPYIGVVFAVRDSTGPDNIGPVTLTMTLVDAAGVSQTKSTVKSTNGPWQQTPDWTEHFDNVARGPYRVNFTASAPGVTLFQDYIEKMTTLR